MASQRIWSCREAEALLGLTGGVTPEGYLEATDGIVLRLAADDSASAPNDAGEKEERVRRRWSLPLGVELNRGQTDPWVKVLARGHGRTFFPSFADAVLVTRGAISRLGLLGASPESDPQGLDELPGRVHSVIGRDWTRSSPGASAGASSCGRDDSTFGFSPTNTAGLRRPVL